jgi:murein DD-endopeptidase MepM/ murein hydrolase activator NlpD
MRFTTTQCRTGAGTGVAAAVALVVVAGGWISYTPSRCEIGPAPAASACAACERRLLAGSADPPAIRGEVLEDAVSRAQPAQSEAVTLGQASDACAFLTAVGLSEVDAQAWAWKLKYFTRDPKLLPGHRLLLYRAKDTNALLGLRYDLDAHASIMEEALGGHAVLAWLQPIRYQKRRVAVAFALNKGFEADAQAHRLPSAVVRGLRETFMRVHPLESAPPGSVLKIVYEQRVSADGFYQGPEELRAARLITAQRSFMVLRFGEGGPSRLWDEHGRAVEPAFLRYPLRFNYISSGFSFARYHPLLHRFRPHLGVDLAARYGSPVRAIGDGEIESAQWEGELGRCVRIRHGDDLVTLYGHLSRIEREIRPGARVKTGQIIGLVGSSGLATGAHLHFAILKDGQYVDPMKVRLEEGNEIPAYLQPRFRSFRQKYLATLNEVEPPYHELVSIEGVEAQEPVPALKSQVRPAVAEDLKQASEAPRQGFKAKSIADRR